MSVQNFELLSVMSVQNFDVWTKSAANREREIKTNEKLSIFYDYFWLTLAYFMHLVNIEYF